MVQSKDQRGGGKSATRIQSFRFELHSCGDELFQKVIGVRPRVTKIEMWFVTPVSKSQMWFVTLVPIVSTLVKKCERNVARDGWGERTHNCVALRCSENGGLGRR